MSHGRLLARADKLRARSYLEHVPKSQHAIARVSVRENLRLRALAEQHDDMSLLVARQADESFSERPRETPSKPKAKVSPPTESRPSPALPPPPQVARASETAEEIWHAALAGAGRHRGNFAVRLRLEAERAGWRVLEQPQLQSYLMSRSMDRKIVPYPDASPRHTIVRRFFAVQGAGDDWLLTSAATIHPGVPEALSPALMGDEHFHRGSIEAKE